MLKYITGFVLGFLAGAWVAQFLLTGGLAMLGGHP